MVESDGSESSLVIVDFSDQNQCGIIGKRCMAISTKLWDIVGCSLLLPAPGRNRNDSVSALRLY